MADEDEAAKLDALLTAAKAMGLSPATLARLEAIKGSTSSDSEIEPAEEGGEADELAAEEAAPPVRRRGRPPAAPTAAPAAAPPERTGRAHGSASAWDPPDVPPL